PVAGAHYAAAVEKFLKRAQEAAWGALPSAAEAPGGYHPTPSLFPPSIGSNPGFGQLRPTLNEAPPRGYFAALRPVGALARRFLLCEGGGGSLVVVDPHAAVERSRASELAQLLRHGEDPSQRSLFAATVELSPGEAKSLTPLLAELERIGIEIEPFGGSSFAVKSLPLMLSEIDARELLTTLAAGDSVAESVGALACLAARSVSHELTPAETRSLFQALERADFEARCKHSQIVIFELPFLELERRARE
ncbi:MAG: DNA mismatch repair endonuclease MutL, partial [Myxococcaceae bacterium]